MSFSLDPISLQEAPLMLRVEGVSKQYRLGKIGTGTLSHDLNRWWHRVRGKEDPYLKIGDTNDRSVKGSSEYVWALKDINFEVRQGEVLGIIGKNGAGKSTLLKILSRVTSPTTGSVKSAGRIASLLEVGTGFHKEMTGRENIYLNGAILGMTKKEIASKLDEIIAFSGCERYIDTPVKRYSSGMTVRLAFAVAAHLDPEILVVDEVLAVGDAEFQKKAIGKMQEISKGGGRTVLFVSHNMAAVKSLCTRGVVLEHGRVVYEGEVDDAVDFYLTSNKDSITILKSDFDKVFLNKFYLKKNYKKVDSVLTGDDVVFCFEIVNQTEEVVSNVVIGIGIKSSENIYLTSLKSEYKNFEISLKPGLNTISCLVQKFPLFTGVYSLNLLINLNNAGRVHYEDFYKLNVELGAFYSSTTSPVIKNQIFLLDQIWKNEN
ncbi:MAG: polysaccharide ABC transporter ATP-binding protein [Flavobacterium sp.]